MQKSGYLKKLGNATTLQYSLSLYLMCPCKLRVMDAVLRLSARQAAVRKITPLGAAGGSFAGGGGIFAKLKRLDFTALGPSPTRGRPNP